jgi:hypothetical protein
MISTDFPDRATDRPLFGACDKVFRSALTQTVSEIASFYWKGILKCKCADSAVPVIDLSSANSYNL